MLSSMSHLSLLMSDDEVCLCELDVKSQPVKTCSAATELHNTEPIACASFIISAYHLVLLLLNAKGE